MPWTPLTPFQTGCARPQWCVPKPSGKEIHSYGDQQGFLWCAFYLFCNTGIFRAAGVLAKHYAQYLHTVIREEWHPLHSGDGLIIHLSLIWSSQSTSVWSSNKGKEFGFNTKRELLLWLLSQRLSFRLDRNHLCQVTQHFAKFLVKSGGNYLLPPQGEGWCCLCTGIPGRLGKQDMKIHSFLQYHPHCLPTKNENVHTWRKKSMSGPKFRARADDCRGSNGEKADREKEKEQHHMWHSPSFTPSCLCPRLSLCWPVSKPH